jgi:mono/diheme cytochrome c family protein
MLRAGVAGIALVILTLMAGTTPQQGCQDLKNSWSHWAYYPRRDMRWTVAMIPQRDAPLVPDSLSVPMTGREYVVDRDRLVATFVNPEPMSDSSVARGERKFQKTCIPCHGTSLKGNGPVAARFVPPPDLLGAQTRVRTDGFIYSYIRHGGAIMPSYGAQVTAPEAYDLINYLRHMQQKNPLMKARAGREGSMHTTRPAAAGGQDRRWARRSRLP